MAQKYIELLGASGGTVFINTDTIAMISVGNPESSEGGVFFDPVRVYFKEGFSGFGSDAEGVVETFYVEDDYLPYWMEHWRSCLGVPEFPKVDSTRLD
jgi:hypothetical protein